MEETLSFPKPNIVISKCINLAPVRYNGGIIRDEFAEKLGKYVNYIPVCPELEIGLGVPRPPINLIKTKELGIRVVDLQMNRDYTEIMEQFCRNFLAGLKEIDGFLLKSKSPSCGVRSTKLHNFDGRGIVGKTSGIFAKSAEEYFPDLPIEDEGRLIDRDIRRNFLIRIFALADLRENFLKKEEISALLEFHSRYKYLLMTYSQQKLKEMGKILANWKEYGLSEVKKSYENLFKKAFTKAPSKKAHYNTILHIMGHYSGKLSKGEKAFLTRLLNKFLMEKTTLSTILEILRELTIRFDDQYLKRQVYLNPYPEELEP
uniref:DUF1722 domain-containing protein n=1 Tax=candidate division WOR-3 bacterium TaxID=2052148 RepID=A0A7C2PKU8_UNCW3